MSVANLHTRNRTRTGMGVTNQNRLKYNITKKCVGFVYSNRIRSTRGITVAFPRKLLIHKYDMEVAYLNRIWCQKGEGFVIRNKMIFTKRLWGSPIRTDENTQWCQKGEGFVIRNKMIFTKRQWGSQIRTDENAQKGCGGRDSQKNQIIKRVWGLLLQT